MKITLTVLEFPIRFHGNEMFVLKIDEASSSNFIFEDGWRVSEY